MAQQKHSRGERYEHVKENNKIYTKRMIVTATIVAQLVSSSDK